MDYYIHETSIVDENVEIGKIQRYGIFAIYSLEQKSEIIVLSVKM